MDEPFSDKNITTNEFRIRLIFLLTVYIPLDLVIIFGNAFVLLVIHRTPSLNEQQFTLLTSLALADLLTGIIGVPVAMWWCVTRRSLSTYLHNIDNDCALQYIPMEILVSTSFLHLVFITTDRYLSILKPLRYGQFVTQSRVYGAIAFSWIIGCGFGSVRLFWKREGFKEILICHGKNEQGLAVQRYMAFIFIPTAVMSFIIMYFRIFMEARKHRRTITAQNTVGTQTNVLKKFKAAKTSALIVCLFGIAYVPYLIKVIFFLFGFQESDLYWCDLMSEALLVMSSAVNPFIYVFRHRQFSSALRRVHCGR
ncbi:adenosine receptor A2a-like [Anneissia japonica]|uniref:adenosine receptor A2a-like n=1 Tax=Anneissia japonica TaxID=1529436 RepID=UPI0014255A2B|nr:adenosine receptor A2a-like [Anneissia japonica]